MKKIVALVLSVVVVLSVLAVSVSATSKSDLLTEAAKSPVYKYVQVSLENAARTVNISDAQAAQCLPYVQDIVAVTNADKGPSAHTYTNEQVQNVIADIDAICGILGYTYTFIPSANEKHAGDIVFMVYDANGALVFQYDGDIVADTSAGSNATLYLAAAVALLGLGVTAVVIARKKVND